MVDQRYIIKIRGKLAQIFVDIDPEVCGPYFTYENGKAVLYLELLKSLYVMLIAPLIFFQKLMKDIEAIGFKVNSYDTCVANNIICNKQITITWNMDELKVSHSDKDVVDVLIQWTKDTYEDVTTRKPSRGKIHDYLAITMDYTTSGEVKNYMK